jgi:hypothetical protein
MVAESVDFIGNALQDAGKRRQWPLLVAAANRIRRAVGLFRAGCRISPRMALFMARRFARNILAVKYPGWYRARLASIARRLPEIAQADTKNLQPLASSLKGMADFYCLEYRDQIDGVLAGRIRLHGVEIDFGAPSEIDWKFVRPEEGDHQMWRVKLAHMGYLCPMLAEGSHAQKEAAVLVIDGFRRRADVTDHGAFNSYWFPYAVSHRILAVGSGLLLAEGTGGLAPEIRAPLSDFLRECVAFVLDNLEHELCNNHLERNLAALCLYFSHVNRVPPEIASRLEKDIAYLVGRTVLKDGTQVERSPMYQGLSVASLAVMAESPFLSRALRDELDRKTDAARRAFALLCHADGQVALFNDSWHDEVPRWDGEPAPEGRSFLPQGGYARLSQGSDLCLLDAGPLGPSWNPGHGHADFLSIEIALGGRRLIVDPGTSRYNTGPDRARERSAAAHNGPVWLGYEPVEFLGCFKVGRMAEAQLIPAEVLPPLTIGGVFRDGPGLVARMVRHYPSLGFLVADLWTTPRTQGQVCWLVPGTWQIDESEASAILAVEASGACAVIEALSPMERDTPQLSQWACQYGRHDPAWELRMRPKPVSDRQALLCWVGHNRAPSGAASDGRALLDQLDALVKAR